MAADIIYEGDEFDNYASGSYREMYGYGGNDTLSSDRYLPGDPKFIKLYGGDDNDYLYYNGDGQAKIYGGLNDDTVFGGLQKDKLYGDNGDDYLFGAYGNDVLNGGKGSDWLFGGYGNDKLKGGKGSDHFGFNTMPDSKTNVDKIKDFSVKKDYIHFNSSVYTSGYDGSPRLKKAYFVKGAKPKDANDYYGYNAKKGILWYDHNGSDPGGFEKVAKLDDGLHITFKVFMFD